MQPHPTGTFSVTVTSGPSWFRALNLLKNKKIIHGHYGYNRALIHWGYFNIERQGAIFVLIYKDFSIIDHVWWNGSESLNGNFYLNRKKIGTFRMDEIKQQEEGKKCN